MDFHPLKLKGWEMKENIFPGLQRRKVAVNIFMKTSKRKIFVFLRLKIIQGYYTSAGKSQT
jgi:hypothetical protein